MIIAGALHIIPRSTGSRETSQVPVGLQRRTHGNCKDYDNHDDDDNQDVDDNQDYYDFHADDAYDDARNIAENL